MSSDISELWYLIGLLVHWWSKVDTKVFLQQMLGWQCVYDSLHLGVGHGGDGHLHQLLGLSAPRGERAPAGHHGLARDVQTSSPGSITLTSTPS